ncbi:Beta-phenylalanine transaminase [Ceratocystis fimbriata CBS 114723]|uniref:Beta-phenylalanine transaminase n=1 Tax=Ceratocystis fimbriata CBS 114723 TaxID=1035309 RepID=A0A2C5WY51_9PEZI|nr:Beta-phenylalanine transaminase [Ceratocystis fimbriata CBS 114723]
MDAQAILNSTAVDAAYRAAEARYIAQNNKSQLLYENATGHLPGGNTRSALFFAPFPLYISSANGCTVTSVDGRVFTDLLGEYSAGIYGHTNPALQEELHAAIANGLSFGGHHVAEAELAAEISRRIPSIDLLRFTNSGTEATMMALATAKTWTGRDKIVVFRGGYHGGGFVFRGGNSLVNVPHDYLVAEYNDDGSVQAIFAEQGPNIAAVIIEPMLGSGGGVRARKEFILLLRALTRDAGALLIFDEVMTSRLFDGSGLQGHLGVAPDLTTLGKYLGGGMSFGAFGGRRDIMSLYDPRGGKEIFQGVKNCSTPLPHAGTFNNNVLTMRVGARGLKDVYTRERATELNAFGDKLRERLNELAVVSGSTMKVLGCGSILVFHFTKTEMMNIHGPADWADEDYRLLDLLHLTMLEAGFYMGRRGYVSLSLAVGDEEATRFAQAVGEFLARYKDLVAV